MKTIFATFLTACLVLPSVGVVGAPMQTTETPKIEEEFIISSVLEEETEEESIKFDIVEPEELIPRASTFAVSDLTWINNRVIGRTPITYIIYKSDSVVSSPNMDIKFFGSSNWQQDKEYFNTRIYAPLRNASGAWEYYPSNWHGALTNYNVWNTNGGNFYNFSYQKVSSGNSRYGLVFMHGVRAGYNYTSATLNAQIYA